MPDSRVLSPSRAPLGKGFTGALAGIIAALCCAVLALVASGGGVMGIGGKGATTVLAALCGQEGCRVMDRVKTAHKGLDPHAAQESLAQLDTRGWRHARVQSAALGHKPCTCLKSTKFARRNSLCTCHCEDDEDGPCGPSEMGMPPMGMPEGDQSFVIPMHESDAFVPPAFEAPGAVQSWYVCQLSRVVVFC